MRSGAAAAGNDGGGSTEALISSQRRYELETRRHGDELGAADVRYRLPVQPVIATHAFKDGERTFRPTVQAPLSWWRRFQVSIVATAADIIASSSATEPSDDCSISLSVSSFVSIAAA